MLILITGNSGSGKTSLGNELIKRGWKSLYNYTTRPPRNNKEFDNYIFLNDGQFNMKLHNGDFIEYTEYQGYKYALGRFMEKDKYYFAIVTPHGRDQLINVADLSFFIDIDKETTKERMINRGDVISSIDNKMKDNFFPTKDCIIIDGKITSKKLANIINKYI